MGHGGDARDGNHLVSPTLILQGKRERRTPGSATPASGSDYIIHPRVGWDTSHSTLSLQLLLVWCSTRAHMALHRSLLDDGGHAVVLISCDPHSLTSLNSWAKK
jgi:hypothetical protein